MFFYVWDYILNIIKIIIIFYTNSSFFFALLMKKLQPRRWLRFMLGDTGGDVNPPHIILTDNKFYLTAQNTCTTFANCHFAFHPLACVFASLRPPLRTMAFAEMLSDEDIRAAVQACQSESESVHACTRARSHTHTRFLSRADGMQLRVLCSDIIFRCFCVSPEYLSNLSDIILTPACFLF